MPTSTSCEKPSRLTSLQNCCTQSLMLFTAQRHLLREKQRGTKISFPCQALCDAGCVCRGGGGCSSAGCPEHLFLIYTEVACSFSGTQASGRPISTLRASLLTPVEVYSLSVAPLDCELPRAVRVTPPGRVSWPGQYCAGHRGLSS